MAIKQFCVMHHVFGIGSGDPVRDRSKLLDRETIRPVNVFFEFP